MFGSALRQKLLNHGLGLCTLPTRVRGSVRWESLRQRHTQTKDIAKSIAFAFDIDGVLLRSSRPLRHARKTLSYLQEKRIPFVLLTNGGGKTEKQRVDQLSELLKVPIDKEIFIQSHTPFQDMGFLKDKHVLVVGGEGDNCRKIAYQYGFEHVSTPGDLLVAFPNIWPFADLERYLPTAVPLQAARKGTLLSPRNLSEAQNRAELIKIEAILVFNDPRDWALDMQIILDLLLSERGYLGSISAKNGNDSLPNGGYVQDGQPQIYFSNPDLTWAAAHHIPRLGQGGFRHALEGLWKAVANKKEGHINRMLYRLYGKPTQRTFLYAEQMLMVHRKRLLQAFPTGSTDAALSKEWGAIQEPLRDIYMIGDNPESDILGANQFKPSSDRTTWHSILVRTGVYESGPPAHEPKAIVDNVWDAVKWGIEDAKARAKEPTFRRVKTYVTERSLRAARHLDLAEHSPE